MLFWIWQLEVLALNKNPIIEIGRHALVGTQLVLLVLDKIRLPNKLADLPTDDLKYLKGNIRNCRQLYNEWMKVDINYFVFP